MIDLRKGIFSMLGQNRNLKKTHIMKHFPEMLFRKVRTYVSSIQKGFIIKVCLHKLSIT